MKKLTPKKKVAKKKAGKLDEYGLTLKERETADLYRAGSDDVRGNAKLCYKVVYPKCKDSTAETKGPQMVRKRQVAEYLQLKLNEASAKANVTEAEVLSDLKEVRDICMGRIPQPTVMTADGETEQGEAVLKFNAMGAIRALELIGKNLKMFTDKVEHSGVIGLSEILNDMDGHITGLPVGSPQSPQTPSKRSN